MATKRQVFISHDTEDTALAHRLARDLQEAGVQVWIAPDNIRPGESWVNAIERGLNDSTDMVIVLTPAAIDSQWVRKETEIGIMRERRGQMRVLPLLVKQCEVPLLLSSYQMVSFRQDYDVGLGKLAGMLGLRQRPAKPVVAKPVAARPLAARPSPTLFTPPPSSPTAIQTRFIEMLSELVAVNAKSIQMTTHLIDDLELDELDIIELAMAVEEEWDLVIPDEDIKRGNHYFLRTVDDWVTYLSQRLRA